MIVKHANNTWINYKDEYRDGTITTVYSQPEYDALETKNIKRSLYLVSSIS